MNQSSEYEMATAASSTLCTFTSQFIRASWKTEYDTKLLTLLSFKSECFSEYTFYYALLK